MKLTPLQEKVLKQVEMRGRATTAEISYGILERVDMSMYDDIHTPKSVLPVLRSLERKNLVKEVKRPAFRIPLACQWEIVNKRPAPEGSEK